ncbi:MAG: pectin acetylesterase-family hydrolase, partial [Aggregatilineales bacterium]
MLKRWFILIAICLLALGTGVRAQESPEWEQILPEGETICGRGAPYAFYVNRGRDPRKLHIHFLGGGACWNGFNCSKAADLFTDEVIPYEAIRYDASLRQGVFDLERADNPLRDYATVLISYCTGDVHVGDRTVAYTPSLSVQHKGYRNAKAALEWVYQNFPEADKVLVSGCSAGSYGAIMHANSIFSRYPNALRRLIGDSGVGVIMPQWDGLERWGFYENLAQELPELADVARNPFIINQLYAANSKRHPEALLTQFTTAADGVQIFFYGLQGGVDWRAGMYARIEALDAAIERDEA